MLIACEQLAQSRGWNETLAGRLTCSFDQWEWKRDEVARRHERQRESVERRDFFRARLGDFALDLVPLDILRPVAEVYEHSGYDIEGETPEERLINLFAGDEELFRAALAALRKTIGRGDLPSASEALAAAGEGQEMVLNLPALISLELAYREDHAFLGSISDDRLVAALVAHLVRSVEDHESWVTAAAASRPQCMADALSAYLAAAMHWKTRSPDVTHLGTTRGRSATRLLAGCGPAPRPRSLFAARKLLLAASPSGRQASSRVPTRPQPGGWLDRAPLQRVGFPHRALCRRMLTGPAH
jgi:hypothetical protein